MAANSLIGNLAVNLSMETAAFQRGAKRASAEMTVFQKRMAGAASALKGIGAGIVAGLTLDAVVTNVRKALDYASSLGEVAQQLGVTTDELQSFRYAATQVGLSQEEIDASLQRLTRTLGDLQAGSATAEKAFARIGVSAADLAGKTRTEALTIIADGLQKVKDPAVQASIGFDIMGKSFQKLMPLLAEGGKGISSLTEEARKLGVILTPEQIKNADEAADSIAKLKQVLEARIAGVVADNATGVKNFSVTLANLEIVAVKASAKLGDLGAAIVEAGRKTREFSDKSGTSAALDNYAAAVARNVESAKQAFLSGVQNVAAFGSGVVRAIDSINARIRAMVAAVRDAITRQLSAVWDSAIAKINTVAEKFRWLWDVVVGNSYVPDMVDGIAEQMARLDAVMVDPTRRAADATAATFRSLAEDVKPLLDRLFPEATDLRQLQGELATIERARGGGVLSPAQADEARRRLLLEGFDTDSVSASNDRLLGIGDGIEGLIKAMPDLSRAAAQTTAQVIDSFAGMAQGVLGSLRGMVSSFKGGDILGGLTQLLGVISQVAGFFGGRGGVQPLSTPPGFGNFGGFRAMGGPVIPGKSYIVGENGPEWFSPGQSGFITPGNDNGRAPTIIVNAQDAVLAETVKGWIAQGMNEAKVAGAMGGAALAQSQLERRERRSLR